MSGSNSSHWWRPKELHQHYEESQKIIAPLSPAQITERTQALMNDYHRPDPTTRIAIQPHVLADAQLLPHLLKADTPDIAIGTREWLTRQIEHPIHDPVLLKRRQRALQGFTMPPTATHYITELEPDFLWALQLPPIKNAWPLPLLFPQWFCLRWLNHCPPLLELYHLYRIYGASASHLLYPLTLFIGPWWYIRAKLKWKLPFRTYANFLRKGVIELLKNHTGTPREQFVKLATVAIYVGVYVYGVIQSIDIALMLYQVRRQLKQRLANIHRFISRTECLWNQTDRKGTLGRLWGFPELDKENTGSFTPPILPERIHGIYHLFRSPALFGGYLKTIAMKAYILQGMSRVVSGVLRPQDAICAVRWRKGDTPHITMIGMSHPMLPPTQQRNPICLHKNLILTGPNAAGKSTYVRCMLSNVLMAHVFGYCFAEKATMTPIHRIASFMRVYDVVGTQSLFEAECRRSLELIRDVDGTTKPTLLFLDEPMNATPPTEGAATAMALIHYLAKQPHVRLMATTHYHLLAELEPREPTLFRNISMEASVQPIAFSYRIRAGPSFQSIAIEMLEKDAFPDTLLADAIEIKNKLCMFENNNRTVSSQ